MRPLTLDVLLENMGKNERNLKDYQDRKDAPKDPKAEELRNTIRTAEAEVRSVGKRGIPRHQSAATRRADMARYDLKVRNRQQGQKRSGEILRTAANATMSGRGRRGMVDDLVAKGTPRHKAIKYALRRGGKL